jgi:hypothetical protein
VRSNNTDDPSINAANANVQAFKLKRLTKEEKTNATKTTNVTTVASPAILRENAASAPMEIGEAGRVSTLLEPELQTQEKKYLLNALLKKTLLS